MISKLLKLSLTAVIAAAILTTPDTAADEKKPEPKKEEKKGEKGKGGSFPFNGIVKSIDSAGMKLALPGAKGKADRVFIINAETKITLDKKPAKLEDIKAGNYVGGSAKKDGDKNIAVTINALLEAPAPKKKDDKK